ncbi:MAG TPA: dynamin family protein, partial [Polyangiaceae bacterium]
AIVGEFNAGKSTFINALIGADVAPTGVLPTTATLHRLHYAPDPIARVIFETGHEPPERIVPLDNLRGTLKGLENEPILRVEIGVPLQALTRVEVLDTPGFNAPDPRHTKAARRAFDESDVVLWLLDATQSLKQTEKVILDEVRDSGIPLQILVNKADRLAPADLEKVMSTTTSSLAEIGLTSWSAPLAFSAKQALAAKLGDENAKAASRWNEVEAMFENEIVARAEALKERALRRRARAAVRTLRAHVQSLVDAEARAAEATTEHAKTFALAAASLERTSNDAVETLAKALTPPIEAWRADVSMVVIGRDARATTVSSSVDRYRAERLLAHLAQPLAIALAGLADGTGLAPSDLLPTARAMVRPFGFFAGPAAQTDALAVPLARAAVATMVELLLGKSAVSAPSRAEEGRARELALLEQALA